MLQALKCRHLPASLWSHPQQSKCHPSLDLVDLLWICMICSTVGPRNKNSLRNQFYHLFTCSPTHSLLLTYSVARVRLSKLADCSALTNRFLSDVQLQRTGQQLEDWDITSQNNRFYLVAAAESKANSPPSHGSLSLPCLPRPVVIPSACNATVKLHACPQYIIYSSTDTCHCYCSSSESMSTPRQEG